MLNAAPAPPTDAAPTDTDTRPDPGAARRARQRQALTLVRSGAVAFHPRYGWTFYGPHGDNELEVRRALQRLTRSGHVVIHDPGQTIQPVTLARLGERTLTILETDGIPKRPRRPTSHQRQYLRKLAGLTSTSYGEPNRRSLASMTAVGWLDDVGAITEAGRAILQPSRMASSASSSGSRSIPERRAKHAWDDGDDRWGERPVTESAAP